MSATTTTTSTQQPPSLVQWGYLSYFIFVLLGITQLLPWNVFMTAAEYFRLSLAGTPLVDNFANYFASSYNFVALIANAIAAYTVQHANRSRWIIGSAMIDVIIFAFMAILVMSSIQPITTFSLTLIMISIGGVSTAYLQNGCFALAAQISPMFIQAMLSGQSIAGLAPALVQYINALHTSPSTDPSPDTDNFDSVQRSVFLVFSLASLVSFISILGYLKMSTKTTHTSYTTLTHEDEEAQTLVHSTEQTTSLKHLLHLLNVMRLPVLVVFLTFLITLAIFPAITVSVTSQDPTIRRDVFIAIHFIIFSSFEWIGRILPGFVTIRWLEDHRHLLLATLGRALLLPLLLLTNIQSNQRWYDPIILNDYLFMLLIALLGLSNGWFSTLGMMYGPTCVTTPKDRAQAGTLMVLVLVVGLAMGAWASFFVRAIVCGCNPFITPV